MVVPPIEIRTERNREGLTVAFRGSLVMATAGRVWQECWGALELEGATAPTGLDTSSSGDPTKPDDGVGHASPESPDAADAYGAGSSVRFDLSGVERLDSGVAGMLVRLERELRNHGREVRWTGVGDGAHAVLELYGRGAPTSPVELKRKARSQLDQLGAGVVTQIHAVREVMEFSGRLAAACFQSFRAPGSVHWRDVGHLMERAGADGLSIVVLINFLIGAIIALQSADQLARFSAQFLVVDAVGFSMVQELAPLMTAIIVAGRSGAAYAAELGTMQVSEEVDALKVMGLDPERFLVIPRLVTLLCMVPLLAMIADLAGAVGGFAVATTVLDLSGSYYWSRMGQVLTLWAIAQGILKAAVFALAIALVSCQKGLATRGGAAGVGRATTSAVVTILFLLVALDFLFTTLFYLFDL